MQENGGKCGGMQGKLLRGFLLQSSNEMLRGHAQNAVETRRRSTGGAFVATLETLKLGAVLVAGRSPNILARDLPSRFIHLQHESVYGRAPVCPVEIGRASCRERV